MPSAFADLEEAPAASGGAFDDLAPPAAGAFDDLIAVPPRPRPARQILDSEQPPDLGGDLIGGASPIGVRRRRIEPDAAVFDNPLVTVPKVGAAQTLADAMDVLAEASRPAISLPSRHPRTLQERLGELPQRKPTTAEQVATGALNVPSQTIEGLTSPKNLALIGGTAGLGGAPAWVKALVSTAFALDMARATPDLLENYERAKDSGDAQAQTEAAGHLLVNTAMVLGAGGHAVKEGRAAFTPEPTPNLKPGDVIPSTAKPADTSPDALAELEAMLRGEVPESGRLKTKERVENASTIRSDQGQPVAPGKTGAGSQTGGGNDLEQTAPGQPKPVEPGAAPEQAAPGNERAAAVIGEQPGDAQVREFLKNREKDYSGMSALELQLLEEMGDQGARSEAKARRVRKYLEEQKKNVQGAPAPASEASNEPVPAIEPGARAIEMAGAADAAAEARAARTPEPYTPPAEGSGYTIADAARDSGGVGAPKLDQALAEMAQGRRPAQVVSDWSGGRGEYDALADVLEQLRVAAEGGRDRKEFRDLAAAYRRAFREGGRPAVDVTLSGIEEAARQGQAPDGGAPSSGGDLIARLWEHATGRPAERVESPVEQHLRFNDTIAGSGGRGAAQNGGEGIARTDLRVGDRFEIRGTGYEVTGESGNSTLLRATGEGRGSPEQFGARPRINGEQVSRIYPDRGTFKPAVDTGAPAGETAARELPRTTTERAFAALQRSIDSVFPTRGSILRIVRRSREAGESRPDVERTFPAPLSQERAWRAFEQIFRRRIVEVETKDGSDLPFQGVTLTGFPKVLFLDAHRAERRGLIILGHEFIESLRLENPELFDRLRTELVPLMKEFPAFKDKLNALERSHGLQESGDIDAQKELIADFVGDCLANPQFLARLGEQNPTVFRRLAVALMKFLEEVKDKLRTFGASRWFNDVQAAEDRVRAALEEHAKGKGGEAGGEGKPEFSLADDLEGFNLEAPESVDEQRARLAREKTAAEEKTRQQTAREELARRRDRRLVGDLGEAGQGGLFAEAGQQELFKGTPVKTTPETKHVKADNGVEEAFGIRPKQTFNYVVFDDSKIKITHKNGEPIPIEQAAQQPFFSLRDDVTALGKRISELSARGESIPPELDAEYAEKINELSEEIRAGRERSGALPGGRVPRAPRTPRAPVVDRGLQPAPAAGQGQFRGEERLPSGGLRDLFASLTSWRRRAGDWWTRFDAREHTARGKDAADNRGDRAGNMAGNHIRVTLNRAFGAPADEVTHKNEARESALSFVVEADGDRGFLADEQTKIANSPFAGTKSGRRALYAIRLADANWDRLVPVAEEYKRLTTAQRETELNGGVNSREWEGGYVHHSWKEVPGQGLEAGGGGPSNPAQPQGAPTSFRRSREYATLADGIAAGGIPKSINAVELLAKRVSEGQRKLNEVGWLNGLKHFLDPVSGEPVVLDARRVPERPNLSRAEREAAGTEEPTADEQAQATPAKWVRKPLPGYVEAKFGDVEVDVKREFAGILTAITAGSGFPSAVRAPFGLLKSITLMGDTFHLGRLMLWRMATNLSLPRYGKGLSLLDYSEADLRQMAERGEIPDKWIDGLVENKRLAGMALRSGFNVGGIVDNMGSDWVHALPGLGRFNHFLFKEFQRGAMMESWLLEFQRLRKAMPNATEQDIARRVTYDLNTRFGNLGRQGLFKSKTAQDFMRILLLAPGWNEGLIRSELGAIRDLARLPYDSYKQKRLVVGTLLRGTGALVVGTFIANQILNYATRGKPTWENEEEGWDKKISAYIPDAVGSGPGFFLNPLALPAEYTHLMNERLHQGKDAPDAIARVLSSRETAPARALQILLTRKDALGRTLRPGEVTGAMAKALIPVPIGFGAIGSAAKQVVTGEPSEKFPGQFQKQAFATFGVKLDQGKTPEQRMRALAGEFNQEHGIVPSAEYYAGDYDDFVKALRIGNRSDARRFLEEVLQKHTAREIFDHFKRWQRAPYTGQARREAEFIRGLSEEQRQAYERSRAARAAVAKLAGDLLRETRTPAQ